jgi:N-methylhydantoinase B
MKAGEVLIVESAGGGGYGPPSGRTPARLEADLADGYVTPEGRCDTRTQRAGTTAPGKEKHS